MTKTFMSLLYSMSCSYSSSSSSSSVSVESSPSLPSSSLVLLLPYVNPSIRHVLLLLPIAENEIEDGEGREIISVIKDTVVRDKVEGVKYEKEEDQQQQKQNKNDQNNYYNNQNHNLNRRIMNNNGKYQLIISNNNNIVLDIISELNRTTTNTILTANNNNNNNNNNNKTTMDKSFIWTRNMYDIIDLAQQCDNLLFRYDYDDIDDLLSTKSSSSSTTASEPGSTTENKPNKVFAATTTRSSNIISMLSPLLQSLIKLSKKSTTTNQPMTETSNTSSTNSITMSVLPKMSMTVHITIATIIACNMLETSIRTMYYSTTGSSGGSGGSGGAPLLKHMIDRIDGEVNNNDSNNRILLMTIKDILQYLLLPKNGLNIRNLLWHGYIGDSIPRQWLSLIIILLIIMEQKVQREQPSFLSRSTTTTTSSSSSIQSSSKQTDHQQQQQQSSIRSSNNQPLSTLSLSSRPSIRDNNNPRAYGYLIDTTTTIEMIIQRGKRIRKSLIFKSLHQMNDHNNNNDDDNNDHHKDKNDNDHKNDNKNDDTMTISYLLLHVIRDHLIPSSHCGLYDYCIEQIMMMNHDKNQNSSSSNTSIHDGDNNNNNDTTTNNTITNHNNNIDNPTIVSTILIILLEHTLRIIYETCNNDQQRSISIAKHNEYYITFDGHGQKNQHDLLLHPYQLHNDCDHHDDDMKDKNNDKQQHHPVIQHASSVSSTSTATNTTNTIINTANTIKIEKKTENKLINYLGGNLVALLTDIFMSPYGPNIRSNIAHGLYDNSIRLELLSLLSPSTNHDNNNDTTTNTNNMVWDSYDIIDILLVVYEQLAIRSLLFHEENGRDVHIIDGHHHHHHRNYLELKNTTVINKTQVDIHEYQYNTYPFHYRPIFSYTGYTIQLLQRTFDILYQFENRIMKYNNNNTSHINNDVIVPDSSRSQRLLYVGTTSQIRQSRLDHLLYHYFQCNNKTKDNKGNNYKLNDNDNDYTVHDIYHEYEINILLEPYGAIRQLLDDIYKSVSLYILEMEQLSDSLDVDVADDNTIDRENNFNISSRKRYRMKRIMESCYFGYDLYSFGYFIVTLFIEWIMINHHHHHDNESDNDVNNNSNNNTTNINHLFHILNLSKKDWIKVIERTRMVISTSSTFMFHNVERSYKATNQYCQNSFIQRIIHNKHLFINDDDDNDK